MSDKTIDPTTEAIKKVHRLWRDAKDRYEQHENATPIKSYWRGEMEAYKASLRILRGIRKASQ